MIQGFFAEYSPKDRLWQQLFFYLKTCFYLSRNQNIIVATRYNADAAKSGGQPLIIDGRKQKSQNLAKYLDAGTLKRDVRLTFFRLNSLASFPW